MRSRVTVLALSGCLPVGLSVCLSAVYWSACLSTLMLALKAMRQPMSNTNEFRTMQA